MNKIIHHINTLSLSPLNLKITKSIKQRAKLVKTLLNKIFFLNKNSFTLLKSQRKVWTMKYYQKSTKREKKMKKFKTQV